MAMGTTVFRIRIELIFRQCWILITPSRSCRGSPLNVGRAAYLWPRTRWRQPPVLGQPADQTRPNSLPKVTENYCAGWPRLGAAVPALRKWNERPGQLVIVRFFCCCGARQAVDGAFQVDAFGHGRCNRPDKSSGPPLLKLSLKVKRNIAHGPSSAFVVAPVSWHQRASSFKGPGEPFSQ